MTNQLTRSAVRIYGALSGLGNGTGDILEGLLPFFDPILRRFDGEKLDPHTVAATIRDTYKWNFNADLVEAFVDHLERQGWIVRDIPQSKDATSYTIQMPRNGSDEADRRNIEGELRKIATKFKEFSESLSPLTAIPRDVAEFEDILVEWLLYTEMFSEKSIDFKVSTKTDTSGTMRRFVEVPNLTSLRDEDKYLCARFVKEALQGEDETGEVLARVAAIGLLTEVVQDFVRPVTYVDRTDLVVYLDAPVALELLGVSGKSARENIVPVIEELIRIGASVRIFGQSIEEIKRSLQTVLINVRPYGPTADALRRGEVVRDYVVAVSRDPASFLEKLGVRPTYRILSQNPNEHRYFTTEHRTELYGRLSYLPTVEARDHDADITTFVVRQRGGRSSPDLFRSGSIVLTRNGLLAQTTRKMCAEYGLLPDAMVPPIIHRRVLATAMWLRTGMGAGDLNIPKRMLLASCEHVLAIRPGVVEAVRKLTDALDDEAKSQQLELLISQDRSVSALMDKTLGSASVVTGQNLAVLWEEMLHPHLEGERQKGLEALSKQKAESRKRLDQAKDQMDAVRRAGDEQAKALTMELEAKRREDRDAIEGLCADVEARLSRARKVRVLVAAVIAILSCSPLFFSASTLIWIISVIAGLIFAYLTATGGKLIGVTTEPKTAIAVLRRKADERRLSNKLDQFEINWEKTRFCIAEGEAALVKAIPERSDVFPASR